MKRKKSLSILIAAALTVSAAGCGGGGSANNTAVEMRVQRQAGTVSLSNEKGENVTLLEKMRLNAGHKLDTAKESLVTVSMDETRLMTLGENGEASVKQDGSTLRFEITKGEALVGLTEELKDDQAFEVRTGNMICGIRGTFVEQSINSEGNPELLVAESKRSDGVTVQIVDAGGNELASTNVEPGEKVELKQETENGIEKSKCNLEDFSALSLNTMLQIEQLLSDVALTFDVQMDDAKNLALLLSQDDTSGGDSGTPLPLFGEQAQAMENAAQATKEATGNEMGTEITVLTNTREVMDKAIEQGLNDADMVQITQNTNECMNGIASLLIDSGLQGVNLNETVQDVSEFLAKISVIGIEEGLGGDDVINLTNVFADGLNKSIESDLSDLREISENPWNALKIGISINNEQEQELRDLVQKLSTDNHRINITNFIQLAEEFKDVREGRNTSNTQPQPTPEPVPEPTPEPEPEVAFYDDDDDDDDDDDYNTPSTPATPASQPSPAQPTETVVTADSNNRVVINGSNALYTPANPATQSPASLKFQSYGGTAIKMPIIVKSSGRADQKFQSLNEIEIEAAVSNIVIEGVSDTTSTMDSITEGWNRNYIVSNSSTKITKTGDVRKAEVTKGSFGNLHDFYDLLPNSFNIITYGSVVRNKDNSAETLEYKGVTIGSPGYRFDDGKDYLTIIDNSNNKTYHLKTDGDVSGPY